MRAIIEIILAIIFTAGSIGSISNMIKIKSAENVYDGIHSIEAYSNKLTEK